MGDVATIIAEYEALIERAIAVVTNPPYHNYISHPEHCSLEAEGDEATLFWPEAEDEYGSPRLESESASFPTALLTLPQEEFAAWQAKAVAEQKERDARQMAERAAAEAVHREANERALLAALIEKYGR